jgi:hypothetical protein
VTLATVTGTNNRVQVRSPSHWTGRLLQRYDPDNCGFGKGEGVIRVEHTIDG